MPRIFELVNFKELLINFKATATDQGATKSRTWLSNFHFQGIIEGRKHQRKLKECYFFGVVSEETQIIRNTVKVNSIILQ